MKGWDLKRIDELGKIVTGKTPSCDYPDEFGSEYPFITPSDIPNTQKQISVERFLSEKGMESHKSIRLPPKTTCVVCIGATIGKVCTTKVQSFSNQQINSIITNEKNDPDFVYYLATTLKDALVSFAGGAATPIVNKSVFSSIKVLAPAKKHQRKIAAILSAYDDLIKINNLRIAILEKMAEELYREWFVRLRFPGHDNVKIVKGVPEGWEVKQITQIYRTSSGSTPSREKSEYYGGNIPWVKTGELKKTFLIKTEEQITENALENSSAKIFPKHTIILAMYCAMGELSILSLDAATNQACCAFLPKYDYLSYPFSYHLIRNVRQSLINLSFGAAQQNLSQEIIKKFKILVPQKELIQKFSEVVLPVFKTIENFYTQNDRLKIFRDRLLSRLMSGKIDVENMDIQFPASMQEELVHA